MSETNDLNSENSHSKVIQFPIPSDGGVFSPSTRHLNEDFELPQFRKITLEAEALDKKSKALRGNEWVTFYGFHKSRAVLG